MPKCMKMVSSLRTPLRCWPNHACSSKSINIRKLTGLSENLDSAIISEAPALPLINPSRSGKATTGRIYHVTKRSLSYSLIASIGILSGGTVPSEGIYGAAAAGHHRERPVAVRSTLTARQLEVVQLLVNGFRVKQIARILEIGRGTVNEHLSCAREKIGVTTREELIAWAVWNGVATVGKAPDPGIRCEPRAVEFAANGSEPEPPTEVSQEVRASGESSGKSRGGRPTVMTPDRISRAQTLLAAHSVAEVAERVGVSRSTLYKYVRQWDDTPNESHGRDPRRPPTMPRS